MFLYFAFHFFARLGILEAIGEDFSRGGQFFIILKSIFFVNFNFLLKFIEKLQFFLHPLHLKMRYYFIEKAAQ